MLTGSTVTHHSGKLPCLPSQAPYHHPSSLEYVVITYTFCPIYTIVHKEIAQIGNQAKQTEFN